MRTKNEKVTGKSGLGPAPRRPGEAEIIARRELIHKLIYSGSTVEQAVLVGARQGHAESAIRRDYEAHVRKLQANCDRQCETARAEAIERIRRDLFELRNPGQLRNRNGYPVFETVRDPRTGEVIKKGGKRPVMAPVNSAAVIRFEEFLAKLEGSARPMEIKVDVDVRERRAAIAIVSRLTPELEERLISENVGADLLERLARSQHHPAPSEVSDADGDGDEGDR